MGRWMSTQTALTRLVEDDDAPVMARVHALEQIAHPQLAVLRRLLVKTRQKPVPSKLKAVAALAYAQELQLRRIRRERNKRIGDTSNNPLGIS